MVQGQRPPDKGKPVICSCCKYSSAGKKTLIYSSRDVRTLLTMLVVINKATEVKALLDSGVSNSFIHQDTAKKLKLKLLRKEEAQSVNDTQGQSLGWITHIARVTLEAANHQEEINLNVIPLGIHGLVMGLPWLQKHDPNIKWSERKIQFSSPFCKNHCIRKAYGRLRDNKGRFIPREVNLQHPLDEEEVNEMAIDALVENPIEHHKPGKNKSLQGVPTKYHNFADVFDLEKARSMPADRGVWNFKINFIEGWEDKLPKPAKQYRLSMDEQKLKQETIKELLEAGMICPSTSPIAAPCFFVPKKDRMLHVKISGSYNLVALCM